MKKFLIIVLLNFICLSASTEEALNQSQEQSPVIPQNIPFENCTKMFPVNNEQLFYLTLGAVTANRFTIDEVQSANGYIIYTAVKQKYLATVSAIDKDNSILKITPCNNVYYFQPGIISGIFKYIELNKNSDVKNYQ